MSGQHAVAVRTGYYARPGRRAIVVSDLASLRGPCRGTVELPLRLYWSGPSPVFDLADPDMRRWLYQIVLREASRPVDLTGYLDRDTLIAVWPEPADVRALMERMEADGVTIVERNDETAYVAFKCLDPDGHRIEVYWEPPRAR
jgi:catechol 2,3-dioxygenase-like lactoylglutathione lyase family enzyme